MMLNMMIDGCHDYDDDGCDADHVDDNNDDDDGDGCHDDDNDDDSDDGPAPFLPALNRC